jgi:anti-sigma-K factor RskA
VSAPALPRNHDDYEALAVAWAINALEPAEQAIFEAHRAGCEDCTRIARETLDIAAELAYGVPDVAPPPQLRERLLADAVAARPQRTVPARRRDDATETGEDGGIERPHHGAPGTSRQTEQRRRSDRRPAGAERPAGAGRPGGPGRAGKGRWLRGRRRVLAVALAAVLVAGSAVTTWQIVRAEQAAPRDRVAALSSGGGTVATIVAHQRGADVVTDSLPPNDGTAYYVWGVPAGGDPQVVGTFVVTATGLHSYPMRVVRALTTYPVLAVSQEAAGSNPTAPSSVIGKGSLGD